MTTERSRYLPLQYASYKNFVLRDGEYAVVYDIPGKTAGQRFGIVGDGASTLSALALQLPADTLSANFVTSNTGDSNNGKFTKVLEVNLTDVSTEESLKASILATGHDGVTYYLCDVLIRVRQGTAFGVNPTVDAEYIAFTKDATKYSFYYVIDQNTPSTKVSVYAQIKLDKAELRGFISADAFPLFRTAFSWQAFLSSITSGVKFTAGGGLGSDTSINVGYNFSNGQLESSADDWSLYADAAGTSPVDGAGGSPTITKAWNGTNPLNGLGDMIITKPASNCQGNGAAKDFTIDSGQLGKVAQLDFDYLVPSAYVSGHANVSIYDITNAKFCPVSVSDISASFGGIGRHSLLFIPNANSKNYRLCLHVASTDTNAYTIEIDNIQLGNWKTFSAPVVSPWVDYSAGSYVFGSQSAKAFGVGVCPIGAVTTNPTKGTTSEDHAQWMREGQDMLVRFDYKQTAAGSAGTGPNLFAVPAGITINTSKSPVGSTVGTAIQSTASDEAGNYTYLGQVLVYSATMLAVVFTTQTAAVENKSYLSGITGNAYGTVRFSARFTCAQFSVNSTFIGVNEPFYLSNSETVANTNGVVSETKLGIDGSPFISTMTATTYYDMTLPRNLLPNETPQIQVHSKIDGNWVNIEQAGIPSLFVSSLAGPVYSAGSYNYLRTIFVSKINAGQIRVYIPKQLIGSNAWDNGSQAGMSWSAITSAADGFDAWRVRIGQASTGAELANAGSIRAWVTFNGTTGAILAGANVSSVTRRGVGKYTINFTNPMPHAYYVGTGSAVKGDTADDGNTRVQCGGYSGFLQTKTALPVATGYSTSNASNVDFPVVSVQVVC